MGQVETRSICFIMPHYVFLRSFGNKISSTTIFKILVLDSDRKHGNSKNTLSLMLNYMHYLKINSLCNHRNFFGHFYTPKFTESVLTSKILLCSSTMQDA